MEIKANLSQSLVEVEAELGNKGNYCYLQWPLISLQVDRPNNNRLECRPLMPISRLENLYLHKWQFKKTNLGCAVTISDGLKLATRQLFVSQLMLRLTTLIDWVGGGGWVADLLENKAYSLCSAELLLELGLDGSLQKI